MADTVIAVVLFVVNVGLAVAGLFMPKEPTKTHILILRITLIALGISGAVFTGVQTYRAAKSGESQTGNILGDAQHPPFVAIISLPGFTRFAIINPSDYPAYINSIQLRDNSAGGGIEARDYPRQELPAHGGVTDERPWAPYLSGTTQRFFVATISTRAGLFTEEMMLRKDNNNQWMRAVRVMQGMKTLEEDIDSAWPRNSNGGIDWKR